MDLETALWGSAQMAAARCTATGVTEWMRQLIHPIHRRHFRPKARTKISFFHPELPSDMEQPKTKSILILAPAPPSRVGNANHQLLTRGPGTKRRGRGQADPPPSKSGAQWDDLPRSLTAPKVRWPAVGCGAQNRAHGAAFPEARRGTEVIYGTT